jgi:hypothetical protein
MKAMINEHQNITDRIEALELDIESALHMGCESAAATWVIELYHLMDIRSDIEAAERDMSEVQEWLDEMAFENAHSAGVLG